MTVLVDTTIWSLALRRPARDLSPAQRRLVRGWVSLIKAGRAALVGPVRQEILSGIRRQSDFIALQQRLNAFPYLDIMPADFDRAASFFNTCRAKGLTGAPTDLLLCAVAERLGVPIFTTDADFARYAKLLPIRLHLPRARKA